MDHRSRKRSLTVVLIRSKVKVIKSRNIVLAKKL